MLRNAKKRAFIIAWIFTVPAFVLSQLSFWHVSFAQTTTTPNLEEVEETKDTIKDLQKEIEKKEERKERLENDLGQIQKAVVSTQLVINSAKTKIQEAEENIKRKEAEIESLNEKVALQKELLKSLMQGVYIEKKQPMLNVLLKSGDFSETLTGADHLLTMSDKVQEILQDILETKDKIAEDMDELAGLKEEHADLLAEKATEKSTLIAEKNETEETLEEVASSIDELKEKLSELQSDLNKILGKSYNAKDVKEAIRFASAQTGVREGFLFGMLSVESRLGASTGSCDYKQSRMSAARLVIFKEIANELGYDYKKLKVSCPPRSYRGTGGAMGAAQFMSDTWKGYKSRIASNTGHNPPDPWNLTDGVMAMALKVANDGGAKDGKTTITSPCTGKKVSVKWEDVAAMKYLGWTCYGLTYAKNIQALSANYKQL